MAGFVPLHTSIRTSPKLNLLPVGARWTYVMLLTCAQDAQGWRPTGAQLAPDGRASGAQEAPDVYGALPEWEHLAYMMGAKSARDKKRLHEQIEQLIEARLIDRLDGNRLAIHDWADWQLKRHDPTHNERNKRYRGNGAPQTAASGAPEAPQKAPLACARSSEDRRQKTEDISLSETERENLAPLPPGIEIPYPAESPKPDPAEVAKVAALADEAAPMAEWGQHVRTAALTWPLDWIRQAILLAADKRPLPRWPYITTILKGWAADGGPPPPPKPRPNGHASRASPAKPVEVTPEQEREMRERYQAMRAMR